MDADTPPAIVENIEKVIDPSVGTNEIDKLPPTVTPPTTQKTEITAS